MVCALAPLPPLRIFDIVFANLRLSQEVIPAAEALKKGDEKSRVGLWAGLVLPGLQL